MIINKQYRRQLFSLFHLNIYKGITVRLQVRVQPKAQFIGCLIIRLK